MFTNLLMSIVLLTGTNQITVTGINPTHYYILETSTNLLDPWHWEKYYYGGNTGPTITIMEPMDTPIKFYRFEDYGQFL